MPILLPLRRWRAAFVLTVLAIVSAALVACGGSTSANAGSGTPVSVTLSSFHVKADRTSVPAGKVTFSVTNTEAVGHEMVIIKTDAPEEKLTLQKDETAVETGKIDEVDVFQGPNTTKKLTVNLSAGKYVLICNQPGHYQSGMHMAFTVE